MASYLSVKDIRNREKEESCSPSESYVVLPSPPPAQTKDKKSVDKGRIVINQATVLPNVNINIRISGVLNSSASNQILNQAQACVLFTRTL